MLNSQEFMRGITQPVPPSTMLYYLDQGWPQQLVLHMFVRSIEFYDALGTRCSRRITSLKTMISFFDSRQFLMTFGNVNLTPYQS